MFVCDWLRISCNIRMLLNFQRFGTRTTVKRWHTTHPTEAQPAENHKNNHQTHQMNAIRPNTVKNYTPVTIQASDIEKPREKIATPYAKVLQKKSILVSSRLAVVYEPGELCGCQRLTRTDTVNPDSVALFLHLT